MFVLKICEAHDMYGKGQLLYFFFFVIIIRNSFAEVNLNADTATRTLADEERLFIDGNFQLLAANYELSAADAAIMQAKLYPNPNLSIDQGVYNKDRKSWFDMSKTGETAVSLQQVILLAGKRNKEINIAKLNSKISTYQFYDLMRTLRYQLQTSFYDIYYLNQSIEVYDKEINSLKFLINVYSDQYKKGNIAFKELARLLALQFNLENERNDFIKEVNEKQSDLTLLTADTISKAIIPIVDTSFINNFDIGGITCSELIDTGMVSRYDLLTAKEQVKLNEVNLALQKAMRVSDITLGANWDRQGSYISNYNSVSLSTNLPIWNRNRGNIKIAEDRLKEAKVIHSQVELQVINDIRKAYSQVVETDKLYKTSAPQFNSAFETLLEGITTSYRNHTINLLEFIDFYETYKNSKIEFNKLQNARVSALENLNLAAGINFMQ